MIVGIAGSHGALEVRKHVTHRALCNLEALIDGVRSPNVILSATLGLAHHPIVSAAETAAVAFDFHEATEARSSFVRSDLK